MPQHECKISETRIEGFDAFSIENGLIAIAVVPALGGKITSMRDLVSGREWLWKGTQLDYREVGHGASYLRDGDFGGWDECFPSVAECPDPNRPGEIVPDHGDLWSQPWEMTARRTSAAAALAGTCRGVTWPYTFRRTLIMRPGSAELAFDYEVTTDADGPLKFIWSAHPLFSADGPGAIEMSHDLTWHTFLTFPDDLEGGAPQLRGGHPQTIDVPTNDAGVAYKVWSDPVPETGFFTRLVSGRDALRFTYDGRVVSNLGIWINKSGFAGREEWTGLLNNLAVEPCIGAQDKLSDAVEIYDSYGEIPARGTASWSLRLRFENAAGDLIA